jgi:hypothetical protein
MNTNTSSPATTATKRHRIRYRRHNKITLELTPADRHEVRLLAKRLGYNSIKDYVIALVRREAAKLRAEGLPVSVAAA